MSYSFRPAIREEVGLLIGIMGPSGSGKTMSAMRLATGIVGKENKFAVIDTESRRALHYADMFNFDHCELGPPFRPENYSEAIKAAINGGYKAIVVDSQSHEWNGEGGILDWQEEELTRMAGDDWKKRDNCKMASWIKPKMAHKQMVQKMLQVNAHLILCFRAEERVKMEKDQNGKMQIIPIGFQPVCSKELPYELTVSFMLTTDKPGYPQPIKLQEQHRAMFPLDKPIDEKSGELITEWAKGGIKKPEEKQVSKKLQEALKWVLDQKMPETEIVKGMGKQVGDMIESDTKKLKEVYKSWIATIAPCPDGSKDYPIGYCGPECPRAEIECERK